MTTPCEQSNRILSIENAVSEIHEDIGGLATDVAVIKDKIIGVVEEVEEHEHILRGFNGNTGIMAQLEQSLPKIDKLDKAMFEDGGIRDGVKSMSAYIQGRKDEDKERGAEKKDNIKWLWRLVAGSLVTAILGWLYVLINLK